ncbi:MAG: protease inhibitor I9 family protein, partial [Solirubrobacteraceae bacterium]
MSGSRRRVLVVIVVTVASLTALGVGGALASARHRSHHRAARHGTLARHRTGPYAHSHHRGLSVRQVLAGTRQVRSRVIVVLRNQLPSLPATRRHVHARIAAERNADATIESDVARSGGHVYRRYHALNAFAARVSSRERAALSSSSQVAQVIPDTVVQLPGLDNGPINAGAARGPLTTGNQVCPTNPADPLLEPEALQTTHTAYMDPSTPQAHNLATGDGVKVAF